MESATDRASSLPSGKALQPFVKAGVALLGERSL